LDRMMGEIDKEESQPITKKSIGEFEIIEARSLEKQMFDFFQSVDLWQCLYTDMDPSQDYDVVQAKRIGKEVIISIFCSKTYDPLFFKNEMKLMELSYLAAHKLFLKLRSAYESIQATKDNRSNACIYDDVAVTPMRK